MSSSLPRTQWKDAPALRGAAISPPITSSPSSGPRVSRRKRKRLRLSSKSVVETLSCTRKRQSSSLSSLFANAKVELDTDQNILAGKRVVLEKTPELGPIYNATGDIFLSHIPAGLRNVIGVLKGRDPKLRDTYVLVTAHYDHVGLKPDGEGDRIYNGANDNASGVAGVIEIARAIASSAVRPRRSLVFIAYFGEERGMVGSRYYARTPYFP